MGVIFVPLLVAIGALFYNAKAPWAWALLFIGLAIILIEILSQLRFFFDLKLSHFLLMLGGFAAGIGLTLRSLRADPPDEISPDHLSEIGARNR